MVLINGCSFTEGYALRDPTCVYSVDYCNQHLLPFTNIAVKGNSNDNIRTTTISELLTGKYKFLMVNWTTPWRLTLGNLMPGKIPMSILPKAAIGSDLDEVAANCLLEKFWELFYDGFYYHRIYFESVFLVQEFCRARGIGYVFTNTNDRIQVSAWRKINQAVKENTAHPDTYIEHFTGHNKDLLDISYKKFYKKNDMSLIKPTFQGITSFVDAIDWDRFVGLDEPPFFQWPDPLWPTGLDNIHPGKEAHLHWKNILNQSEWLTQEITDLKKSL
jgi:hypothetical protein